MTVSPTPGVYERVYHQRVYKKLPLALKPVAKMMASKSHAKFVSDTLVNWTPKMLFTVRSLIEAVEVSFLEFVESGFFYYSPNKSGSLFRRSFHKLAPNPGDGKKFPVELLGKSVAKIEESHPQFLKQVLPVKAGLILASCAAVGIAGEYALSFLKNLITIKAFKKSDFSDIVNLRRKQDSQETGNKRVKQKAYRRLKQIGLFSLGALALALLVTRFGHKAANTKLLEGFVKRFDFEFDNLGKLKLSHWQLAVIIGFGVISYLDAARDKLEFKEILTRLSIVAPYLVIGQELLMKALTQPLAKWRYRDLLDQTKNPLLAGDLNKLLGKGFEELSKLSYDKAKEILAKENPGATEAIIEQKAAEILKPIVRYSIFRHLVSLGIGSIAVGLTTTKMAQYWTKRRVALQKELEQRQNLISSSPPWIHPGLRPEFAAYRQQMTPFSTNSPVNSVSQSFSPLKDIGNANNINANNARGITFPGFQEKTKTYPDQGTLMPPSIPSIDRQGVLFQRR